MEPSGAEPTSVITSGLVNPSTAPKYSLTSCARLYPLASRQLAMAFS